jgi:hypothetical protein
LHVSSSQRKLPSSFHLTSPCPRIVHHLSGLNKSVHWLNYSFIFFKKKKKIKARAIAPIKWAKPRVPSWPVMRLFFYFIFISSFSFEKKKKKKQKIKKKKGVSHICLFFEQVTFVTPYAFI